jgi:hypothetical protein
MYGEETCLLGAQNQKKEERVQMRFLRSVLTVIFRQKTALTPFESAIGIQLPRFSPVSVSSLTYDRMIRRSRQLMSSPTNNADKQK